MTAALEWLEPLRDAVPEVNLRGWHRLAGLADSIADLASAAPPAGAPDRPRWLLALRTELAGRGYRGGPMWQTLAQFVAGFHDLDFRDATGAGHAAMIVRHAPAGTAALWRQRVDGGALVGIAATERHGGSRIRQISTSAREVGSRWLLSGEKCWVSRLAEATALVVFFRDPHSAITAAVVDTDRPGLTRQLTPPVGLGGWSWGALQLRDVAVDPTVDLLGGPGAGLAVFRQHFTAFRPLVGATALGAAAGVHTLVRRTLAGRHAAGVIDRVRDNALIALGRAHGELTAALLATLHTSRLAATGHPHADLAARVGKAVGVDVAHRAVAELAPLIGAAGFVAGSPIAKARADLGGLLYADGIHDALYRSAGGTLLTAYGTSGRAPDPESKGIEGIRSAA
ncbi:hypothetical protein GCM10010124_04910 [Pilimelia terevasa]|uniref:Acyl-CoA dehydrogenase n=1 Tax=Pilimelia terevasa TaxID=53372 RepID=A0A8J3BEC3_9ACTN|nr:acyl-CoA dehydrogenase family protein [Pilimelia terevasa]GGK15293.1 hypothetical protein GCM10010124_04910 [Pilimelia terevasa]